MMLCNFLSNVLAISMVEEFYIYAVVHFFFAKRKSVTYECNTKVAGEREAAEQRPPPTVRSDVQSRSECLESAWNITTPFTLVTLFNLVRLKSLKRRNKPVLKS